MSEITSEPAELHVAIGHCSLGAVLVARSERGVCAILLGDAPEAVFRELSERFPRTALIRRDDELGPSLAQVVGVVEKPDQPLDLLLDLRGTTFQQRVWQALREIPAGSTVTYTQVAARIGAPGSVRAVAQACAANRLALAVPCHRVIRSDGTLSGYRWGVSRKKTLLDREARR